MDFKTYNVVDGFNIIAPAYDIANDAMTFGLHRLWRKKLIIGALKDTQKAGRLLDVATGTGDVIFQSLLKRPDIYYVGVDPSQGMLEIAKQKFAKSRQLFKDHLSLEVADGRSLPFPDASFDTVTISWGIRNIVPFSKGLQEMKRVLKPGGKIWILESGQPEFKVVRQFYKLYAKVLPMIGQVFSDFKPAYQYYTHSVENFPSGARFVAELFEAGFLSCKYKTCGGGIVYIYSATKPK